VSPALLSRLSSGPISVDPELHHSLTNTTHLSPSPIAPGIPRRRSHAADARHLVVDRPSQAPSGQIGPTTVIPYPRPCFATTPSMQNRDPGGEPPRGLTGGRAPTDSPPPNAVPSPSLWHVGPRPRRRPRTVPPLAGQVGRLPARAPAGPNSPLGPANRKFFIFFFCPFLFHYIYMYIY
jgi:hypothetical protein